MTLQRGSFFAGRRLRAVSKLRLIAVGLLSFAETSREIEMDRCAGEVKLKARAFSLEDVRIRVCRRFKQTQNSFFPCGDEGIRVNLNKLC
jgi:hypothetical protein